MAVLGAKLHPTYQGCCLYHWLATSADHLVELGKLVLAESNSDDIRLVFIKRLMSIVKTVKSSFYLKRRLTLTKHFIWLLNREERIFYCLIQPLIKTNFQEV